MAQVSEFEFVKIDQIHVGHKRVAIHHSVRDKSKRHQIVKLTVPSGKYIFCEVIGRQGHELSKLGLDYDDRLALGLELKTRVCVEVRKVGLLGQTYWFITNNSLYIRISAILAILSVVLGAIGVATSLK